MVLRGHLFVYHCLAVVSCVVGSDDDNRAGSRVSIVLLSVATMRTAIVFVGETTK